MKKLVIIICLLLQIDIPVFGEYIPIPESLGRQYKTEMEQIINEEYPKAINNVDNAVTRAKKLQNNLLNNGINIDDYMVLTLIPDTNIPAADLDLYARLMKVTQEKYLGMKYTPLGTDSANPIYDFLKPYFRDNNVNEYKLIKIINYENRKIKQVNKYIKRVEKLRDENGYLK